MLGLRAFAVVSVAMSIAVGMVVFSRTSEYRVAVAPPLAAGAAWLGNGAHTMSTRVAALFQASAPAPARLPPAAPPKSLAARPAHDVLVATAPSRAHALAVAVKVTGPAPLPPGVTAVVPAAPQTVSPDPAQLAEESGAVARRVSLLVPARLIPYFDLYLYVSKAKEGPWAQRLFLFHKTGEDTLVYEDSFAVSTGRERREKYFTDTPAGLFELDPNRFEPMHISRTWDDARMPWSMFFNYQVGQHMAGIALHAAVGRREDNDLGHRASGGCVRLPLERADRLYHRFQAEERGMVPVLAFDSGRNATSVSGDVAQDGAGNDLVSEGYKVLVVIDDFPGEAGSSLVSQDLRPQASGNRLYLAAVNPETDPDWYKRACFG